LNEVLSTPTSPRFAAVVLVLDISSLSALQRQAVEQAMESSARKGQAAAEAISALLLEHLFEPDDPRVLALCR
jgi:hypothetical protein